MAKPEWGNKHTCEKCGARFYDLRRVPAVCPTCGTEWTPPKAARPKREVTPIAAEAARPKAAEADTPVEPAETPDNEVEDEEVAADADADIAEGEAEDVGETFPERKG